MKQGLIRWFVLFVTAGALFSARGATHYVSLSGGHVAPFDSWVNAATNIQAAVDEAGDGDEILVADGHYYPLDEISITRAISLRSVNGATTTIVDGGGAHRCFNLDDVASSIEGLTMTNGYSSKNGGGIYCSGTTPIILECVIVANSCNGLFGGGTYKGSFSNCVFRSNTAKIGGGGSHAFFYNSALIGNTADWRGGGASSSELTACTVSENSSLESAGGVVDCTLYNCLVEHNHAKFYAANWRTSSFEYSCTTPLPLGEGNISETPRMVDAIHLSASSPCIAAGNPAYSTGKDVDGEIWKNPPSIGADEFSENAFGHIAPSISCIYTQVITGFSVRFEGGIDGNAFSNRWEFGDGVVLENQMAAEHSWNSLGNYSVVFTAFNQDHPSGVSATTSVSVVQGSAHYVALESNLSTSPYTSWATAATNIQQAVDVAIPGEIVWVADGIYDSGSRVCSESATPSRLLIKNGIRVFSTNTTPSATRIIGDGPNGASAVRCAYLGTDSILSGVTLTNGHTVSSGTYPDRFGGGCFAEEQAVLTNCLLTGNAGGVGGGIVGGKLVDCTLSKNQANSSAGGAYYALLYRCLIIGNSETGWGGGGVMASTCHQCEIKNNTSSGNGGGAASCILYNCILSDNSSSCDGGASSGGILYNCTLTKNSASAAGGASLGTLHNCVIWGNSAPDQPNWEGDSGKIVLAHCCTTPLPPGVGNIEADPLFVDAVNGDFHLQSSSPCINGGDNRYAAVAEDLDGNPRIIEQYVDMGAYEFFLPAGDQDGDGLPNGWEVDYFGTCVSADPAKDPDSDGLNTLGEYVAGTDPTNAASYFQINSISNRTVFFPGLEGRLYTLYWCDDLLNPAWYPVRGQVDVPGTNGLNTLSDWYDDNRCYYRVEVKLAP